jgi:hypothetical protein
MTFECPFCHEKDFDEVGLKYHLLNYCEAFDKTPSPHSKVQADKDERALPQFIDERARDTMIYTRWDLWTRANNMIEVRMETNDNNDDGYPDNEPVTVWERVMPEKKAREMAGKSHRGYYGQSVDVYLDGKKI